MTVDPVYTPTPISQRDGSALANSNCRMASIATGVDYQTKGKDRSTGAKMRSYTSDQSGGTDSADAVQAWRNGYAEDLVVRDGYTFDNALDDLRKGSAVHLDVWHASVGSQVCISGSGAYGHTMFVLPDEHSDGGRWRVADPWCSPASWSWVDEAKLRAGAEEWGRRVYGAAVSDADWPTGGGRIGDPRAALALAIVRRIVRLLMTASHPGAEDTGPGPTTPPDWGETGGGKPILFTRTAALGVAGGTEMGVQLTMTEPYAGVATVRGAGHSWIRVWDGFMGGAADGFTKPVYARAKLAKAFETPGSSPAIPAGTPVVLIGDDLAFFIEADVELVADEPAPAPSDDYVPAGELYVRKPTA